MKSLDDVEVEALMYKFYNEGFNPLYPFYYENDNERILEFIEKKRQRMKPSLQVTYRSSTADSSTDIEQDDDLIGDDYFASLLNFDREIVVSGKLHKYTYEGVFRVDLEKKADLDTYIIENNITELYRPDPTTIERGLVEITPTIERYAPEYLASSCGTPSETLIAEAPQEPGFYDEIENNSCDYGSGNSGSGSSGSSTPNTDHSKTLNNYISKLTPCDNQSGGIFGWNPFGTSRKCFENHSSNYRTKTKYWNEDVLFYASVGVKVKHQKKNIWWAAKNTEEVALVINQAIFTTEPSYQIPNYASFPTFSSANNRVLFFEGRFYPDIESYFAVQGWTPPEKQKPTTPFQDDIIIQEYIDLPILRNANDIEIEAKEINKLFWEKGVYSGAKNLMNQLRGEDPKRITYIVNTPQKAYIQYVDLSHRVLNTKKIVDRFDYDWGGSIKFTIKVNNGSQSFFDSWVDTPIANDNSWGNSPNLWNPVTSSVSAEFAELTEFETISMDFVGVTRRNDTWKGSRIVYSKN